MVQVVNENMMDFLSGYTVSHVAKEKKSPRKIIGISSDNTIEDALVLMRENKTLYLGVCFDSSGEDTGNIHKYGKFEDLLGLIDLINFVVTNPDLEPQIKEKALYNREIMNNVFKTKIKTVLKTKTSEAAIVQCDLPLVKLLEVIIPERYNFVSVNCKKARKDTNQILVERADASCACGIDTSQPIALTRHDLLNFFNNRNHIIQPILDIKSKQITELLFKNRNSSLKENIGSNAGFVLTKDGIERNQNILYMTPHTLALEGFKVLNTYEINSLPILNANNEILSDIEISAFCNLNSTNFHLLGKPVLAFLNNIGTRPPADKDVILSRSRFINKMFTLNKVFTGMINAGTRQVWVIGDKYQVNGVISIVDILDTFLKL